MHYLIVFLFSFDERRIYDQYLTYCVEIHTDDPQ
jgi:hypothetical protein